MWFLKNSPSAINLRASITSLIGGYQQTSIRFSVDMPTEDAWIAIAFPWSAHKENGSLEINDNDGLEEFEESSDVINLSQDDVQIWERLRAIKAEPNIDLFHVQEMISWYLDDIGVMTYHIKAGQTYQINYKHKIAADSCLFLPTRLPVIIGARNPEMNYKVWVKGSIPYDLPKWLKKSYTGDTVCLTYGEWGWDDDTRIGTDNWDSTDDEDLDSDSE